MSLKERINEPSKKNVLSLDGHYIWGGSVIKDDEGLYHIFASGWEIEKHFSAWVTDSKIFHASSCHPDGPFEIVATLDCLHDQSWSAKMVHNPTVIRYGKHYYLFYVGTTYEGTPVYKKKFDPEQPARYNQCIGVAVADTPYGPWKPSECNPILKPRKDYWDSTFVTNPSVFVAGDEIRLIYKAKLDGEKKLILGMASAKHPEGPYDRIGPSPLFKYNVEDPYVWFESGRYKMIVKAMDNELVKAKSGLLFESDDGMSFEVSDDPFIYDPTIHWNNRKKEEVVLLERPQLLIEEGKAVCLYNAVGDGETYAYNLARLLKE